VIALIFISAKSQSYLRASSNAGATSHEVHSFNVVYGSIHTPGLPDWAKKRQLDYFWQPLAPYNLALSPCYFENLYSSRTIDEKERTNFE